MIQAVHIGPSWERGTDGRFVLPERSLGWHAASWAATWLRAPDGSPWMFTSEQFRWLLHWYALTPEDRFIYRDGVLQRLKGWGKDGLAAVLSAVEFIGPCRPAGHDATEDDRARTGVPAGQPMGRLHPQAWVQIAAVSKDQTRTTMTLLPGLLSKELIQAHDIEVGKEVVYADHGRARIEAVTSSPRSLEGSRATLTVANETHHWLASNGGHEMAAVIDRNAAKSSDGSARTLAITNAWQPGEDSVAERAREAWESMASGRSVAEGVMYDSLEAAPDSPMTPEAIPEVIEAVRGDSTWLDVERITQACLDPRNPPSRSRRFWFNQAVATEDAWVSRQEWDACADPMRHIPDGARITLGFDGSFTDDHSALMATLIEADHLLTLGVWVPGSSGEVDRAAIDLAVRQAFDRYEVVAFYSDLHPFESYVDRWAEEFGEQLLVKATPRHPVAWDLRGRQQAMTAATERLHAAIVSTYTEAVAAQVEHRDAVRLFTHDGHPSVAQHAYNCRRRPNRYGIGIGKEHRESARKIDSIPAAILARTARQDFLALPEARRKTKVRSGKAAFF